MPEYQTLQITEADELATLVVNRPEKLNALNRTVLEELRAAVAWLSRPSGPRAVILTGAGERAFVAGADIAEMSSMGSVAAASFAELGHAVMAAIEAAPCPFLAAVNGVALGGGTELVLACDFAYASDRARFGQPEVGLGLMPGFGGTQRLARRVGPGRARELIYTGDPVGADQALSMGLVNAVVPGAELLERVTAVARKIASRAPLAVAASKRALLLGAGADLLTACELEARAFAALFGSEDQREGTRAFLEKRAAKFTGR